MLKMLRPPNYSLTKHSSAVIFIDSTIYLFNKKVYCCCNEINSSITVWKFNFTKAWQWIIASLKRIKYKVLIPLLPNCVKNCDVLVSAVKLFMTRITIDYFTYKYSLTSLNLFSVLSLSLIIPIFWFSNIS